MLKEILESNKVDEAANLFKLLDKETYERIVQNNKDIKDKEPVFTTIEKDGEEFLVLFDKKANKMVGYKIDGETLQETPALVIAFFEPKILN